jgi:uncharacterized protein YciI
LFSFAQQIPATRLPSSLYSKEANAPLRTLFLSPGSDDYDAMDEQFKAFIEALKQIHHEGGFPTYGPGPALTSFDIIEEAISADEWDALTILRTCMHVPYASHP